MGIFSVPPCVCCHSSYHCASLRRLLLSFLYPPIRCLYTAKSCSSCILSGLNKQSSVRLSSYVLCTSPKTPFCPPLDSLSYVNVSCTEEHKTGPYFVLQVPLRGRTTLLDLFTKILLVQLRMLLAIFTIRTRCWLMFFLLSTRTDKFFPAKLLPRQSSSAYKVAWGCSSPRSRFSVSLCWASWVSCQPISLAC